MAVLYTPHFMQFFDDNGDPLASGKLYTYAAGTTTPKATYTTQDAAIPNANPIILDANGRATLFIDGSYKFRLESSAGVLIKETDNISSFNAVTEATEGFFQSFSGDGATVAFTLTDNLGSDEKALFIFAENEYSTNGTFASDTGWSKGAGWTIAAGVATATGAISTSIEQSAGQTLVEGKSYSLKYTITRSAGTITPSLGGTAGTARSASGTYSETIIAGTTQTISFATSGFTGTLDNVSIRDVTGPVIKNPNSYTVNGTALSFAVAPASGTNNILVFAPYTLINAAGAAQVAADSAIAAAAQATGAVDAVAYKFNFDSSTTMADPGTGDFRLNNATISSATAIAVDALSAVAGNPDVSDAIAVWGASTNSIKGQIKITKVGTPATFAVFNITSAVTDNTGWLQIAVAYVAGNGTLSAADECYLQFTRTGDLGATGAQGPTGTISGASSGTLVGNDKLLFLDTSSADALTYDDPATIDVSIFGSGAAADNFVLTADGAGGTAFEALPAATTATAGVAELATDAEFQTGTDTSRVVTPSNVKNSLGFSKYYQSAQQTITAAGALTLAHGLGVKPILIYPVLQCTTAEHGYSIADEVQVPFIDSSGAAAGVGFSCVPDATNLNVRYGSGANTFIVLNKTTGAVASITNSSWRLVLRAWA